MPHVMFGGLVHEQALRLPGGLPDYFRIIWSGYFFPDSGSVAVEIAHEDGDAILAQPWSSRQKTVRGFSQCLSGDTSGRCPSVIRPVVYTPVSPASCPTSHHRFTGSFGRSFCARKLLKDRTGTIAAIIVEPMVQGAGGMKFHDAGVLRDLRALADKNDALLIFDEVFTGFGRTGTMFACEQAGAVPESSHSRRR